MIKKAKAIALIAVVALLMGGVTAVAQSAHVSHPMPAARLLIVDETKTFTSTMRVGITANVLKKMGLFTIAADMVNVSSSYADPLAGKTPPQQPYDIVLIFPRGLDDGSVHQIWVITRDLAALPPQLATAVTTLKMVINKVFAGVGTATDVNADLFPGLFSALYVKEGWL